MLYTNHLLRHTRCVIGSNIHRLRCAQKMPLGKLAKLTGIPRDLLDHYELGKNQPYFEHLVQIACALGSDTKNLLLEQP